MNCYTLEVIMQSKKTISPYGDLREFLREVELIEDQYPLVAALLIARLYELLVEQTAKNLKTKLAIYSCKKNIKF